MRLIVGELYFLVSYHDAELCFPEIESVIYIGKNIAYDDAEDVADLWSFQDVWSYVTIGSIADDDAPTGAGAEVNVIGLREVQVETMVFDEDGLEKVLRDCRQRRAARRST